MVCHDDTNVSTLHDFDQISLFIWNNLCTEFDKNCYFCIGGYPEFVCTQMKAYALKSTSAIPLYKHKLSIVFFYISVKKNAHASSYHWCFGKVNKSPVVVTDNQVTSNAVKSDDSYSLYRCLPSFLVYKFTSNWMACQKPVYRIRIHKIRMLLGLPDDPVVTVRIRIQILPFPHKSVQRTEIMVASKIFIKKLSCYKFFYHKTYFLNFAALKFHFMKN